MWQRQQQFPGRPAQPSQADFRDNVMYTMDSCAACQKISQLFVQYPALAGYVTRVSTRDPAAEQEARARGVTSFPTAFIGGRMYVGPQAIFDAIVAKVRNAV